MKAFITKKGGRFGFTHDLAKLAQQAERLRLSKIDPAHLGAVQCSPGVRYDVPISQQTAISAYHSATKIFEIKCLAKPSTDQINDKIGGLPKKPKVESSPHSKRTGTASSLRTALNSGTKH